MGQGGIVFGRRRCPSSPGFAYPLAVIAVVALGLGALAAVELESTALWREREAELLFRGQAIREGIRQYYEKSPGTLKTFPQDLKDLISDPRTPGTRRYLRKLYRDPMTPDGEWVLVRGAGGGVRGVRSASERAPFKRANFPKGLEPFAGKEKVSEWVFEYVPAPAPSPPPARP
ncbi:MAG: type II secretion system protein [Nitrospirae bacterium]|nr:type II secretion system protein [Nitrospirota bacterium]